MPAVHRARLTSVTFVPFKVTRTPATSLWSGNCRPVYEAPMEANPGVQPSEYSCHATPSVIQKVESALEEFDLMETRTRPLGTDRSTDCVTLRTEAESD